MRISSLYLFILLSYSLPAQEITVGSSALSHSWHTAGGTVKNEIGSVAFTVGQVYHEIVTPKMKGSVQKTIQRAVTDTTESNMSDYGQEGVIKFYPNPFTDHFVIKFRDGPQGFSNYSLFDLEGRLLQGAELDKTQTRVNLNFLSSGLYLLKIIQQNATIKTLKILKN